jgi:hypothetical protein
MAGCSGADGAAPEAVPKDTDAPAHSGMRAQVTGMPIAFREFGHAWREPVNEQRPDIASSCQQRVQ